MVLTHREEIDVFDDNHFGVVFFGKDGSVNDFFRVLLIAFGEIFKRAGYPIRSLE